jgi:hypothetical protein
MLFWLMGIVRVRVYVLCLVLLSYLASCSPCRQTALLGFTFA